MQFHEPVELEAYLAGSPIKVAERKFEIDPSALPHLNEGIYSEGDRTDRGLSIADECLGHLAADNEIFLWITDWGVWPSTEDWPAFYALRGANGERFSLVKRPIHRFTSSERALAAEFLSHVLANAWDADVVIIDALRRPIRRVIVSHDEWLEIHSAAPQPALTTVRPFKSA